MRALAWLTVLFLVSCVLPRPIVRPERSPASPPAVPPPAAPAATAPSQWRSAGSSIEGRPIRVRQVGRGPRRVLWIGGIHGDEREGSVATAELPAAFAGRAELSEAVTLTIVDDLNPDGTEAGRRTNERGVDLNRNFPARNFLASPTTGEQPLDQPEAAALHGLVLELAPDLVIVAHSTRGRRFINFDGPAAALAQRFADLSAFPIVESNELHPTPGSLGSWFGRDLGRPILTIEFDRGEDPAAAWEQTREAILAVIAGAS